MMKKYTMLLILLAMGLSSVVYGQEDKKKNSQVRIGEQKRGTIKRFTPKGIPFLDPFLPARDTVIMRGEEVEVGGYLSEQVIKEFEIVGFGKSKKSDLEKGFYIIKLKPKQTTTYLFKWVDLLGATTLQRLSGRIVYVAKTEEEKKQLEKKIEELKKQGRITDYTGPNKAKIIAH